MNFIEKARRSWHLLLASLQVLRLHPKLSLFPLISSALSMVAAFLMIGIPISVFALQSTGHPFFSQEHWAALGQQFQQWAEAAKTNGESQTLTLFAPLMGALLYLVSMFLATFCNVALYEQVFQGLNGGAVSVRAGFRFAASRVVQILYWSLFASTIGLLLQAVSERFGWLGKLAIRLVGVIWSVASIFVIPVIIRSEEKNPLTLVKNSLATLRQTWGESVVAYIGFNLVGVLILLPFILACTALIIAAAIAQNVFLIIGVALLFALGVATYLFVSSLAGHVYRCALYVYATEGIVPSPYTTEQLDSAWKIKG